MRQAIIKYKGEEAGLLSQEDNGSFTFQYYYLWLANEQKPAISLTLPKSRKVYHSDSLFPFFFNMVLEGTNKQIVSKSLRIDENDYFGLLLNTAKYDTIGAISIQRKREIA